MNNVKFLRFLKTWLTSVLLFPIVLLLLYNSGKFIPFLDHINLLFHEGGHGIFKIFGKFVYTLGGSLMQIIIPLLFIFYFYTNGKKTGTQISLVYLGQNILNISVYVSDASKMKLPLLGGNRVYHDWNYILGKLNLINYDEHISKIMFFTAAIIFLLALVFPLVIREHAKENIDLKL